MKIRSNYFVISKWTSELSISEISDMARCFDSAFGRSDFERNFYWKYIENPFGDSLHLLTYDADEMVASRSFWRLDKGVDNLQCIDTAVKQDHQRRGIFRINIEYLDQNFCNINFYNYPNDKSLAQYLKYGWVVSKDFYVTSNFSKFLYEHAPEIKWSQNQLIWRYCRSPKIHDYFISTPKRGGVYLWGYRRNFYPVLLGKIAHELELPVKNPMFGFSYDGAAGFPLLRFRPKYISKGPVSELCQYFRFDMA